MLAMVEIGAAVLWQKKSSGAGQVFTSSSRPQILDGAIAFDVATVLTRKQMLELPVTAYTKPEVTLCVIIPI